MIEANILIEILRAALQSITTERHGYATTLGQNVIAVEGLIDLPTLASISATKDDSREISV